MSLRRVRVWLRSLLLRRRLEREMQEEMGQHLERATARRVARGLPPEEARRAALREFGNVGWLQERARDARGAGWVDALAADLRFAGRRGRLDPRAAGGVCGRGGDAPAGVTRSARRASMPSAAVGRIPLAPGARHVPGASLVEITRAAFA
jgi:hypothetical protein